jgi:hypothetical protein
VSTGISYCRITFRLPEGKARTVWASKIKESGTRLYYSVVDKEGERQGEMVVVDRKDIVSEKQGAMNLK